MTEEISRLEAFFQCFTAGLEVTRASFFAAARYLLDRLLVFTKSLLEQRANTRGFVKAVRSRVHREANGDKSQAERIRAIGGRNSCAIVIRSFFTDSFSRDKAGLIGELETSAIHQLVPRIGDSASVAITSVCLSIIEYK